MSSRSCPNRPRRWGFCPATRRLTLALRDGGSLSAIEYADPDSGEFGAPRVTFLHGAGLDAHTWDTTALALRAPAIAIDLPGHGDSSWRDDADYSARSIAPAVIEGLRSWTTTPQVLVGQSLGGLTAVAVGAQAPDLVSELVLVDIVPGIDLNGGAAMLRDFFAGPSDWATRDEVVDRAIAFGLGGDREATERGVFLNTRIRPDGRIEWKHHFAHIANALSSDPDSAAAIAARATAVSRLVAETGWEDIAAVTAPLLLVRGTTGFLNDADVARFAEARPDATIVTVETGHNVQEQDPARLAEIIRPVLSPGQIDETLLPGCRMP